MNSNTTALLTMVCAEPRTLAGLRNSSAWSLDHIQEMLEDLRANGLVFRDAEMVWRPTPAGRHARGWGWPTTELVGKHEKPDTSGTDSGGRKEVVELRLDAKEALKDLAELRASIRDERAHKVLLVLLATVERRGGAEELARRAYELVDAMEAHSHAIRGDAK